jgi:hypothetical protein
MAKSEPQTIGHVAQDVNSRAGDLVNLIEVANEVLRSQEAILTEVRRLTSTLEALRTRRVSDAAPCPPAL